MHPVSLHDLKVPPRMMKNAGCPVQKTEKENSCYIHFSVPSCIQSIVKPFLIYTFFSIKYFISLECIFKAIRYLIITYFNRPTNYQSEKQVFIKTSKCYSLQNIHFLLDIKLLLIYKKTNHLIKPQYDARKCIFIYLKLLLYNFWQTLLNFDIFSSVHKGEAILLTGLTRKLTPLVYIASF